MRALIKLLCYLEFHKYLVSHEGLQDFFELKEEVHHRCLHCKKECYKEIDWS